MWLAFFLLPFALFADVSAIYLSWYEDPTTTMTVQWLSFENENSHYLFFKSDDTSWEKVPSTHSHLTPYAVHQVHLKNLKPNTEYFFSVADDDTIYSFKTAPENLDKPIRFITGGDIFANTKLFKKMAESLMKHNPLFASLSGEIGSTFTLRPSKSNPMKRWVKFLKSWQKTMVTKKNRLIPFLLMPGSEDIAPDDYETFFTLFAFPEKQLYRALDFGSYLSLIFLDTNNFQPIEGRQTYWLNSELEKRTHIPYRFAIYHEAGFPSTNPYFSNIAKKIRTYWVPLFEKYKIQAAFENHNSAYKRTYPILNGQIHSSGIIYIGDGGWGTPSKSPQNAWYLDKKMKRNSALLVELSQSEAHIQALDLFNESLDQIVLSPISIPH